MKYFKLKRNTNKTTICFTALWDPVKTQGQVPWSLDLSCVIWPDRQKMVLGTMLLSSTDEATGARILSQLMVIRDRNRKRSISETFQKPHKRSALASIIAKTEAGKTGGVR